MLERKKYPRQKITTAKRCEERGRCNNKGQLKISRIKTNEKKTLLKKKKTRDVTRGRNKRVQKIENDQRTKKNVTATKNKTRWCSTSYEERKKGNTLYWKKEEKGDVKDGDMHTRPTKKPVLRTVKPPTKREQRKKRG